MPLTGVNQICGTVVELPKKLKNVCSWFFCKDVFKDEALIPGTHVSCCSLWNS
jgi:hypothetical protein